MHPHGTEGPSSTAIKALTYFSALVRDLSDDKSSFHSAVFNCPYIYITDINNFCRHIFVVRLRVSGESIVRAFLYLIIFLEMKIHIKIILSFYSIVYCHSCSITETEKHQWFYKTG